MSKETNQPFILTEIDDLVIETEAHDRPWYHEDPYTGVPVADPGRKLHEVTISFYFIIPELTGEEDQPLNLLTLAKGVPGTPGCLPSFWDSILLEDQRGGIYAKVTYFPKREELHVTMNVGGETRKLVGVVLEGVSPDQIRGRVLELYAEISPGRIFASVHDRFLGGDFAIDATAPSTGGHEHPWEASPSGNWWVMAGLRDALRVYDGPSSLPPGFGLSNLRITLGSAENETLGSLPYKGALDHLVAVGDEEDPFDAGDLFDVGDLEFADSEKSIPQALFDLADQIDGMSDGVYRWAVRARGLAEETEQLAMRLPEDLGMETSAESSELNDGYN